MSNSRSVVYLALVSLLLGGCAVFGSKKMEQKHEGEISSLMLDQRILETRLSLAEDRIITMQSQLNNMREPGPAAKPVAPKETAKKEAPAKEASGVDYQKALDSFMTRNYRQSEVLFGDFIKKHPQSPLQPNAGYWLGESYYAQRRYAEAILIFQSVTGKYPRHHKAADSLLKTGYSYEKLGDKVNARFYLGQVLQLYPDTRAASLAGAFLAELN